MLLSVHLTLEFCGGAANGSGKTSQYLTVQDSQLSPGDIIRNSSAIVRHSISPVKKRDILISKSDNSAEHRYKDINVNQTLTCTALPDIQQPAQIQGQLHHSTVVVWYPGCDKGKTEAIIKVRHGNEETVTRFLNQLMS
jgi:hypothetical protein